MQKREQIGFGALRVLVFHLAFSKQFGSSQVPFGRAYCKFWTAEQFRDLEATAMTPSATHQPKRFYKSVDVVEVANQAEQDASALASGYTKLLEEFRLDKRKLKTEAGRVLRNGEFLNGCHILISSCRCYSTEANSLKEEWLNSTTIPEPVKKYFRLVDKLIEDERDQRLENMRLSKCLVIAEKDVLEAQKKAAEDRLENEKRMADVEKKAAEDRLENEKKLAAKDIQHLQEKLAAKNLELLELCHIFTPRGLLEEFEGRYKNPRKPDESRTEIWIRAFDQNSSFSKCLKDKGIHRNEVAAIAKSLYSILSKRVHDKFPKLSVNAAGQVEITVQNLTENELRLFSCVAAETKLDVLYREQKM